MNLNKKWAFKDNSVDIVYASHLFEHLSLKSATLFLQESYRCLMPGGVIRIVVPDLFKIAKRYINEYNAIEIGDTTEFIMWAINMHREGQYGNPSLIKKLILLLYINITITNMEFITIKTLNEVYGADNKPLEVHTLRFDTLINKYNIQQIDFLKTDCEGGEYDIFNIQNLIWIKNCARLW